MFNLSVITSACVSGAHQFAVVAGALVAHHLGVCTVLDECLGSWNRTRRFFGHTDG